MSRRAGRTVVIGYGNRLRGDDGVGPRVARSVGRRRPDVRVLAVHQLVPELAAVLADTEVAVFVDARAGGGAEVRVARVEAGPGHDSALGHVGSPRSLLALAHALYGRGPRAFAVTVPAARFAFGDRLSPTARAATPRAVAAVCALLPAAPPRAGDAGVSRPASSAGS